MGKATHKELYKKLKFDHKWYIHTSEPVLENETLTFVWGFDIQMDHLISARRPDIMIINKEKRPCRIVDFTISADQSVKLKESEKKHNYLDFARELKKKNELWNMKVNVIPIVIGALSRVTKGLVKGLEDMDIRVRVDTIQTTALLRSARILRRVLETYGDLLPLKLH